MNPPPGIREFLQKSNVTIVAPSRPPMREFEREPIETNNFNSFVDTNTNVPDMMISRLDPGMYNIMVNRTFGSTMRISLPYILNKPIEQAVTIEGFTIEVKEIVGLYGQFTTGFSRSREYGTKGNMSYPFFVVQFSIQMSNGREKKNINFRVYKNGKIHFSGGFLGAENITGQPELVRKYIVDTYTERQPFLYGDLEYNNVSGQFKVNGIIDLIRAGREIPGDYSYEEELSPFLYKTYEGYRYNITRSGNVQIIGAKSANDMVTAYEKGRTMVSQMYALGIVTHIKPGQSDVIKMPKEKKVYDATLPAVRPDEKKCLRMSRGELVDIAKKLGVIGIKAGNTKKDVCLMISKVARARAITNGNKSYNLYRKGDHFMVGKRRCTSFKKQNISRIARGAGINVANTNSVQKVCNKIESSSGSGNAPPKMQLSSPQLLKDITSLYGKKMKPLNGDVNRMKMELNRRLVNVPKNKFGLAPKKVVEAMKKNIVQKWKMNRMTSEKRRLNTPQLLEDIRKLYGKKFSPLNGDVNRMKAELHTRLANVPKNSAGFPLKMFVDAAKADIVREWKESRIAAEKRKVLYESMKLNSPMVRAANAAFKNRVPKKQELTKLVRELQPQQTNGRSTQARPRKTQAR